MAFWRRQRCHECGAKVPRDAVRCQACSPKAAAELDLHDRMLGIVNPEQPPDPHA